MQTGYKVSFQEPQKRNSVIQNITKTFNIRIAYQPAKYGKDILIEEEQNWLVEFLDGSSISYTNPLRKPWKPMKWNNLYQKVIYFGQSERFWKLEIGQIW